MARMTINGLGIEYELLGDKGAPAIALTPGGRFPITTVGLRELGLELVKGGKRVLIWDRPNCGLSDLNLDGESESGVNGRTLATLIRELDLGPTALAAGSAGSRVSMIAAAAAPDLISHMVLWWISGGPIGLMSLAAYYYGEAAALVTIEACVRLVPGVLGQAESLSEESFEDGLLEHPQFTRPRTFEGREIPEVLLGGNHGEVRKWRQAERERVTRERRPDLWNARTANQQAKGDKAQ